GSAEIADQQACNALGESLHQPELATRSELADSQRHLLVIDRIAHLVALEHVLAGKPDLQVERHRLREVALALVNANERLDAQVADHDGVHGGSDSIESSACRAH